ncbi:MAG: hypothetical protein AAF525_09170 [Pseudomonadota bacterium]
MKHAVATLLFLATFSASAESEWELSGFIAPDLRIFSEDPMFPGQSDDFTPSVAWQPELRWQGDDQRFTLIGFARADGTDSERTHADIREAFWSIEGNVWDLNIGLNKVFWGVTESNHLVDVINQTDLVEDFDGEDKLGQPMINLNLQQDWGLIELFVLPGFRERTFPGRDGRLRFPLPVSDSTQYEDSSGKDHIDLAVRYAHYIGDIDFAVYWFDGTSREPMLMPGAEEFTPFYQQMTQIGIELQYTREAWLWKLEVIDRETSTDDFVAFTAGLEYSFYGVAANGADLGILVEWLHDDRGPMSPTTAFADDWFIGTRLAMNDSRDTSVLAGVVLDPDSDEQFWTVEAETRFSDRLTGELRLRLFEEGDALLSPFANDDYLQLRVNWYL